MEGMGKLGLQTRLQESIKRDANKEFINGGKCLLPEESEAS